MLKKIISEPKLEELSFSHLEILKSIQLNTDLLVKHLLHKTAVPIEYEIGEIKHSIFEESFKIHAPTVSYKWVNDNQSVIIYGKQEDLHTAQKAMENIFYLQSASSVRAIIRLKEALSKEDFFNLVESITEVPGISLEIRNERLQFEGHSTLINSALKQAIRIVRDKCIDNIEELPY